MRHLSIKEIKVQAQRGLDEKELTQLEQDPRAGVQNLAQQLRRQIQKVADEQQRLIQTTRFERELWKKGIQYIAGVDEVGAGPLAGPVVAAAVILPAELKIPQVDDSKKLSAKTRERLDKEIRSAAIAISIAECSPEEIDRLNILQATKEAMRRAVMGLSTAADIVLVDARQIPGLRVAQKAIIGGDRISHTIAAASIIAKVYRDSLMEKIGEKYPEYGFAGHKGYGTAEHLRALEAHGPTPWHRFSFAPVREAFRS